MDLLPDWAPPGVDPHRASAARMWDWFLGGAHNFGIDRELGRQALELYPDGQVIAQAGRAFLHRVVRYLLTRGVRQFVDVGAGIPTVGNVHEVALAADPESRVLYVDNDPVAVAHSELLLQDVPSARVLQADLRDPDSILGSSDYAELIDPDRPVALLLVSVLHFVTEAERPERLIQAFRERTGPGSHLAVSQNTGALKPGAPERVREIYSATATPVTYRSPARIAELFAGWELVEPGVVWVPLWRPDWPDEVPDRPEEMVFAGGVGRRA